MKMEEIARELIKAVDGTVTDKYVQGVLEVFNGIKHGCDLKWENYLRTKVNELLYKEKVLCICGVPVMVEATAKTVVVKDIH